MGKREVMTEREKMLAGKLYDPNDDELTAMRLRVRLLCEQYNRSGSDDPEGRRTLLDRMFARAGDRLTIEPPFFCDYGCHIALGENVYINFNCVILDVSHVTIGDNVMLAPAVQIYTGHHPIPAHERIQGRELGTPIRIGDNVWIGGGAIILPGVTVGANTTVGAGSVVTRTLPPNVVAAGNPCRILRELPPS